jgi:hypothetical protein
MSEDSPQDKAMEKNGFWNIPSVKLLTPFWTRTLVERQLALAAEVIRFGGYRLMVEGEYLSALAHCKTPEDVFRTQSIFVQSTIQDYSVESAKLMCDAQSIAATQDA